MLRVRYQEDTYILAAVGSIRTLVSSAAIGLALLATGCSSFQKDHFTVGSVPSDYRTKHPIIVQQDEIVEDLIVTSGHGSISSRHRDQVLSFLGRFKSSGAQHIRVILPAGSHNEAAARNVGQAVIQLMKDCLLYTSDAADD